MAAYSFHVSFYATGLRHDDLSAALDQLAPIAARYGASHWSVHRSTDDLYKFLLVVNFSDKIGFQKFWYGDEAVDFRAQMAGSFQNPVVYVPHEVTVSGDAVTA